MATVFYLRQFVNERLTAAAEEIFGVFEKTIVEYEEEIDRQRRLLDIIWKPDIKLHRIELQQQHEEDEEVLSDQQLCKQERNFSLDQEDPESQQMKEELHIIQEGEQLGLKQETDTFTLIPTCEESCHKEDQILDSCPGGTHSLAEEQLMGSMSGKSFAVAEPNSENQLLFHSSPVDESQDHKGEKYGDSGTSRNAEPSAMQRQNKTNSDGNNADNSTMSEINCNTLKIEKSFKCDTCGIALKYMSALKRHKRTHTGEKPYFCNTCGNCFFDLSALNRHIVSIHKGVKPYACNTCGKRFSRKSHVERHTITHRREKPYPCNICEKRFCNISDQKRHIMRVHTCEKPFSCHTCEKRFSLLTDLKRHLKIHPEVSQSSVVNLEALTDQRLRNRKRNPSLDPEDSEPLQMKSDQEENCANYEGELNVLNQETQFNHTNANTDMKLDDKHFRCLFCSEEFNDFLKLRTHLRIHSGEKRFKCDTCGKGFNKHALLKNHMMQRCRVCRKEFKCESNHINHMKIHSDKKQYDCVTCGKSFSRTTDLKRHNRTHTGEKPYSCPHCGKEFSQHSTLTNHVRVHTGEKPYQCSWCGKRFALRTTMKIHTRVHTGEKPYECNICGKTFAHNTRLKLHSRIHVVDEQQG